MVSRATQLALIQSDFGPVRGGDLHYVPAIQNKSGELEALRHASDETWSKLTPLVEIVGPKARPVEFKRETVFAWVKRIADAVGQRPCFLDVLRLRPAHRTTTRHGTEPVLSVIYQAARKRGVPFVPVLPVGAGANSEHRALVGRACAIDQRGVALRYRPLGLVLEPQTTPASLLSCALDELGSDVVHADLIIDLGYLPGDQQLEIDDLVDMLAEVTAVGPWRSFILLGTSIPSTLGAVPEDSIGELQRREWVLWSRLRQSGRIPLPSFGDYVIQHPDPPHSNGGPGLRANIRYTVNGTTLVARARGPVVVEGREQYRELCRQIVSRRDFAGDEYSWGDRQIAACARGEISPGSQTLWRGAGTSHHFRVVTETLGRESRGH